MRNILSVIGIVLALIVALFLFKWISGISSNQEAPITIETNDTPTNVSNVDTSKARGIKRIQEMANASDQKIIEFGDFVYLGGPWGLIVGSKKDEGFQQYLAQERVQKVEIKKGLLHYQELNNADGNWEHKTINLQAYEQFLNIKAAEQAAAQEEEPQGFLNAE